MSIDELLNDKGEEILKIAQKHGARRIRVFGSTARGEARANSDDDFLVELEEGRSLLDLSGLWQDLEAALGCKVDLAEPEGLHWYVRDRILREAVPL